jgi:cyanate permease
LGSGLLALLLGLAAIPTFLRTTELTTPAPTPIVSGSGQFWPVVTAYGLFGFGYVITATFLVAIVRGSDAVRPLEGVVWVVVGLAAAPSVAVWAALAKRAGSASSFGLACLVLAIGVTASVAWLTPLGALVGAALLGGTFMGITALGLIEARARAADGYRAVAVMTAAFGLGQIVGPAFAGFTYEMTGSLAIPSLAAMLALVIAAGLVGLRR